MFSCRISNTVTDGVLSSSVLCFLVGPVTQLLMATIKQCSVFSCRTSNTVTDGNYQAVFCVFV